MADKNNIHFAQLERMYGWWRTPWTCKNLIMSHWVYTVMATNDKDKSAFGVLEKKVSIFLTKFMKFFFSYLEIRLMLNRWNRKKWMCLLEQTKILFNQVTTFLRTSRFEKPLAIERKKWRIMAAAAQENRRKIWQRCVASQRAEHSRKLCCHLDVSGMRAIR